VLTTLAIPKYLVDRPELVPNDLWRERPNALAACGPRDSLATPALRYGGRVDANAHRVKPI